MAGLLAVEGKRPGGINLQKCVPRYHKKLRPLAPRGGSGMSNSRQGSRRIDIRSKINKKSARLLNKKGTTPNRLLPKNHRFLTRSTVQ